MDVCTRVHGTNHVPFRDAQHGVEQTLGLARMASASPGNNKAIYWRKLYQLFCLVRQSEQTSKDSLMFKTSKNVNSTESDLSTVGVSVEQLTTKNIIIFGVIPIPFLRTSVSHFPFSHAFFLMI